MDIKENPDFVIVGAGPVGLWTAIQLKKRASDSRVIIFERYSDYQRSHVIRLDKLSLLLYCKRSHDSREQAFYDELVEPNTTSNFILSSMYARNLFQITTAIFSAVGFKLANSSTSTFKFL